MATSDFIYTGRSASRGAQIPVATPFPEMSSSTNTTFRPAVAPFRPAATNYQPVPTANIQYPMITNTSNTLVVADDTDYLHVSAARPGQEFKEPRINDISTTAVKAMANGTQVFLYIAGQNPSTPGRLITTVTVPLMALAVLSPVINVALRAHNKNTGYRAAIHYVVLPHGTVRAHREFFSWIQDVILNGKMVPLRQLTTKPLITHAEIIKICNQLKITWLAVGLKRRSFDILKVDGIRPFTIHPGDVREVTALDVNNWLRVKVVEAIAQAERTNTMHPSFAIKLQDLCGEVVGLREEVDFMIWKLSTPTQAVQGPDRGLADMLHRLALQERA